jgi:tetratricopeptide (TPR) repeat protein
MQAEELFREALDRGVRVLGPEHPQTLGTMHGLALVYAAQGKTPDAVALLIDVLARRRRVLGSDHPATTGALEALGEMLLRQNRYAEAEPLLKEALSNRTSKSAYQFEKYNCQSLLGASLEGQGRYAEAEPLLLSGFQGLSTREATIPAPYRLALEHAGERIARLYEEWGRPEQAADWRNRLRRP